MDYQQRRKVSFGFTERSFPEGLHICYVSGHLYLTCEKVELSEVVRDVRDHLTIESGR